MAIIYNNNAFWLIGVIVVATFGITLAAILEADMSVMVYLLTSTVVLFDGFDILARLWLRHNSNRRRKMVSSKDGKVRPYAILVSIHNMEYELDTLLETLKPYRSSVWIIDDCSSDATVTRLRVAGWRYIASPENFKKPGAIRQLLKHLPPEIGTVLVMDPDVSLPDNLEERLCRFQRAGHAALCPKITVRPDGNLAELQHIEYALSFDLGRHSLSPHSVTSGIGVYDRAVLDEAMKHHSLSVYGEDLENAVTILGQGHNIVYDPELIVETEGKRDVYGWFSQRVGWSFSLLKVYAEHLPDIKRIARRSPMAFYQFGIYFAVLCMLLWPLKLLSIGLLVYSGLNGIDALLAFDLIADNGLNHPGFFAACYFKYSVIVMFAYLAVAPRSDHRRGMLFMPFFFIYCIALAVPTTIGYMNWLTLRLFGFRVFADHYDNNPVLGRNHRYVRGN